MNRDEIMALANQTAGQHWMDEAHIQRFANLVALAEREILADWMRQHGFSTGQAYTTATLLDRLGTEMVENADAAVLEEREACAKLAEETVCDTHLPTGYKIYGTCVAKAIRGRSNT